MEKVTPIIEDDKLICPKCNMAFIKNISECYGCSTPFYSTPKLKEKEEDLIKKDTCPKCEGIVDDKNNRYCDQCGYDINPPETIIEMICKKCDEIYPITKKYCPKDGTKLTKQDTEILDDNKRINKSVTSKSLNVDLPPPKPEMDKNISHKKHLLNTNVENIHYPGFFNKLSKGDYGLFKTYWLFGILIGTISSGIIFAFDSENTIATLTFIHYIYQFIVLIGIWNASNKYKGNRLWAILAKIVAVISALLMIIILASITIALLFE